MAEHNINTSNNEEKVKHRGRIGQIGIYFPKFLRMFVYQSDWKVLPMTALIAGLVGFVMGKNYMVTMNGTLTGTFALVCVCIWNGCFNSVQVICRERDVVKREHRSGMHISSYIVSHMLYQLLLCLLQTIITLQVTAMAGMKYPEQGLFTPWFLLDFGFTVLMITYAADMMSLWISALSRTTTTAMTIMPFVLVFQLIFSGGVIAIPKAAEPISMLTVSSPGFKALATQADVNSKRNGAVSKMLFKMKGDDITFRFTLGQLLDFLSDKDNQAVAGLRAIEIEKGTTVGELLEKVMTEDEFADLRNEKVDDFMTVGEYLYLMDKGGYLDKYKDIEIQYTTTVGELVDTLAADESMQGRKGEIITVTTTLGDLIDLKGEKEVKLMIDERVAEASYDPKYEYSKPNIMVNWGHLATFIILFSALSVITLEFIDKDKR